MVISASAHQPHPSLSPNSSYESPADKRKSKNLRQYSLTLNLHVRPQRQLLDRHTSPRRLHIPPVRLVHFVHSREMLHIRQENIHLEDSVDRGAGSGEDRGEVKDALVLWLGGSGGCDGFWGVG